MIAFAAIAVVSATVGIQVIPPPEPTPLTDVQQELLTSGMFEEDSFREPAFEALIENVRSWPAGAEPSRAVFLNIEQLENFNSLSTNEPGTLVIAGGEVMMVDPVGDAFQGVSRLTLKTGDRVTQRTLLVFTVDQTPPSIGDDIRVIGRAYKLMLIPTQQGEAPAPFPAVVGRFTPAATPIPTQQPNTGTAIITALTGALAVLFFIVVMGKHMLGNPNRQRPQLASPADPPDDHHDA